MYGIESSLPSRTPASPSPWTHGSHPTWQRKFMKINHLVGLAIVAASTVANTAWAQQGLTREQVRAELFRAQHDGLIPFGDLGTRPIDIHPELYPRQDTGTPKTRAEVQAELKSAIAAGDVMVGDSGRTEAEIDPGRYPKPSAAPGLTRAQVRAETLEAIRRGDIQQGDSGLTLAQINPSYYAAARGETPEQARRLAMK
jgi:hypothetical protein